MPELSALRRYRGRVETAFATDETDQTLAEVRCVQATFRKLDEVLRDEGIVQRTYTRRPHFLGRTLCEVDFVADLYTAAAPLNSAASNPAAPRTTLGLMMRAFLGGWVANQGSASASGEATTGCVVTGGHGGRFGPGRAVGVETTVANEINVRWLKTVSTDTLAWKVALAGAPANGADIFNSETFYLTDDLTQTFQLICETADRDWIWLALGLQATAMTLQLPSNGVPRVGWTLRGANYEHEDEFTSDIGGSALAAGTYVDGDPPIFMKSSMLFGEGGASAGNTTRTPVQHASISINPRWSVVEVPDVHGVNGIGSWQRTRPADGAAATVELTVPIDNEQYWDGFRSKTKYHLEGQIGVAAGSTWGIECATLVMIAPPEEVDVNGMLYQRLQMETMEDENATDQSTEGRVSPVRFANI